MIYRLMCGLVTAVSTYTNDNDIHQRSFDAFDLEPHCNCKAFTAQNKTLKLFHDCAENGAQWVNQPNLLKDMYHAPKKQKLDDSR